MSDLDTILNEAARLTEENAHRLTRWKIEGDKDIYCLVMPDNTPFYVGASAAIGQKMSAHRKEFVDLPQFNALLLEIAPEDWRIAKLKWTWRLLEAGGGQLNPTVRRKPPGCRRLRDAGGGLLNQEARSLVYANADRAGVHISRHNFNRLTEESIAQSKPRGAILDDVLERYFSAQDRQEA
ncbi:MAG TPA: hypothetical protein ENI94_06630 [Gammaproteobacteria bacterium]|nr:hypothetical protein [Gammaproteobacteria bacterium]